jgi:hypothetical protein
MHKVYRTKLQWSWSRILSLGTWSLTGGHGESNKLFYNFSPLPFLEEKRLVVKSTGRECLAHFKLQNQPTETMK